MQTVRHFFRTIARGLKPLVLLLPVMGWLLANSALAASPQSVRDAERGTQFYANAAAGETATELTCWKLVTFPLSTTNLSSYETPIPSDFDSYYQSNFYFSNPLTGLSGRTSVDLFASNRNVFLKGIWDGIYGSSSTYRIRSNVKGVHDADTNSAAQALLEVELDAVPIFEFAIFYNGLLEFSDTATMVVTGRVHANSNIYVGSPSDLTFNFPVTCSSTITAPANLGMGTNYWTGKVNYFGTPAPGYTTNVPRLILQGFTNASIDSAHEIIDLPQVGEDARYGIGQQRYYNKAQMVVLISNVSYCVILKSSAVDSSPVTFTNLLTTLTNNNASSNYFPFLTTTNLFYDWREGKNMKISQIDVGKLTNWMQTNVFVYNPASTSNKFSNTNPLNIIYIADLRTTSSTSNTAVRLFNGANLPVAGLTVATLNPLYIWGIYNCPYSGYQNTTNTLSSAPASVVADAVTILSPGWTDKSSSQRLSVNAQNDTVNTAMIAGNVPSTGTTAFTFSGGLNNLPRLLENWTADQLWVNGCFICLYRSTSANAPYQLSGYYFNPPTRHFAFDQNFNYAAKLPPGTPMVYVQPRRTYQRFTSANAGL